MMAKKYWEHVSLLSLTEGSVPSLKNWVIRIRTGGWVRALILTHDPYPECLYLARSSLFFQWSCMDVTVGLWRRLSTKELMLWTVVLEKTLECPLDCKEIQPVHFEGDEPWDFFGRNDAEAETPKLWLPHAKSWLIGKDSDAGRDWGQKEKGTTEDEMAGWHHWLDGRESQWTPGVGDGQGGLECCNSWGRKESDTTERLIWSDECFITGIYYLVFWIYNNSYPTNSCLYSENQTVLKDNNEKPSPCCWVRLPTSSLNTQR